MNYKKAMQNFKKRFIGGLSHTLKTPITCIDLMLTNFKANFRVS